MSIVDRLRAISVEIREVQVESQILDEQILFQSDVAEDARIRALVSETPLAVRESTEASGDLALLRRARGDLARKLDELRAEQDRLLDKLGGAAGR
ncbi:MAG: hypothetical protein WDA27_01285 [Actinomycetota bacterium]